MAEGGENGQTPGTGGRRKGSFAHGDVLKFRRSFDGYDHDKSGTVNATDLGAIVNRLGYRLSESQIKDILDHNQLDYTSKISFIQFMELVPKNEIEITPDEHRMADLREKFRRYDMDANGVISLQEAQWALQVELKITPPTALRLLNQFVKLDYDQFIEFYQKVQEKKLEIYEKFGRYDQDRDGMISIEEAHDVLHKELGYSEKRSKALVEKFDLNKDGNVSYMEFAEFYIAVEDKKNKIRQAFRTFDVSGKGYVNYEEAEQILSGMLGFSHEKSTQTIEAYDKNKDGKIDYEEFLDFFAMLEEERQRLLEEFQRYDSDKDGKISYEEFKTLLLSEGYSETEIEKSMAGYDLNKDGYLDFDEFKHFLNFS